MKNKNAVTNGSAFLNREQFLWPTEKQRLEHKALFSLHSLAAFLTQIQQLLLRKWVQR